MRSNLFAKIHNLFRTVPNSCPGASVEQCLRIWMRELALACLKIVVPRDVLALFPAMNLWLRRRCISFEFEELPVISLKRFLRIEDANFAECTSDDRECFSSNRDASRYHARSRDRTDRILGQRNGGADGLAPR